MRNEDIKAVLVNTANGCRSSIKEKSGLVVP